MRKKLFVLIALALGIVSLVTIESLSNLDADDFQLTWNIETLNEHEVNVEAFLKYNGYTIRRVQHGSQLITIDLIEAGEEFPMELTIANFETILPFSTHSYQKNIHYSTDTIYYLVITAKLEWNGSTIALAQNFIISGGNIEAGFKEL